MKKIVTAGNLGSRKILKSFVSTFMKHLFSGAFNSVEQMPSNVTTLHLTLLAWPKSSKPTTYVTSLFSMWPASLACLHRHKHTFTKAGSFPPMARISSGAFTLHFTISSHTPTHADRLFILLSIFLWSFISFYGWSTHMHSLISLSSLHPKACFQNLTFCHTSHYITLHFVKKSSMPVKPALYNYPRQVQDAAAYIRQRQYPLTTCTHKQ